MQKRPESVLVVVFTVTGQVLLLQRADDLDFWQSVTGSLEAAETPLQAAHRELAEETGLCCENMVDCARTNRYPIREQWRHRFAAGTTHNTEHVFLAPYQQMQTVKLSPEEHVNHAWVPVEQALQRLWSSTNRQAVIDFVVPATA